MGKKEKNCDPDEGHQWRRDEPAPAGNPTDAEDLIPEAPGGGRKPDERRQQDQHDEHRERDESSLKARLHRARAEVKRRLLADIEADRTARRFSKSSGRARGSSGA